MVCRGNPRAVLYTTFYARHATIDAKRDEMLKLVRGLYRTQKWLHREPPDAVAATVRPYFPNLPQPLLHASIARYKTLGIWSRYPYMHREGYERLVGCLVSGGFAKGTPYEIAVDNSLAEEVYAEDPPAL